MRCALFLCVLLATAASGQTPDPNPPWSYAPLGVGDVRSYFQESAGPVQHWRTDYPAELTVDGHRWLVRRTQRFLPMSDGPFQGWSREEQRVLVRYDSTAANVVVRQPSGEEEMLYPCRLDLPIPPPGESLPCDDGAYYRVDLDVEVQVGDQTIRTAVRSFEGTVPVSMLAAGIGDIGGTVKGGHPVQLVGAVVDADTLAVEPLSFPPSQIDPTPAWKYDPMTVGDEWQYERTGIVGQVVEVTRWSIPNTTEVDGQSYFRVNEDRMAPGDSEWTPYASFTLRYDTLLARVVNPEGWSITPCPWDEPVMSWPLPERLVYCGDGESGSELTYAGGGAVVVETNTGPLESWAKSFGDQFSDVGRGGYVAGIGFNGASGFMDANVEIRLRYARVHQGDGNTLRIGSPYPVAIDAERQTGELVVRSSPTPTTGPLAVTVNGAREPATIEVFDALGRRVWHADAVRQRVEIDASGWAPGLYVVRAHADAETATQTVTVTR